MVPMEQRLDRQRSHRSLRRRSDPDADTDSYTNSDSNTGNGVAE
jgi:hypothetical protein